MYLFVKKMRGVVYILLTLMSLFACNNRTNHPEYASIQINVDTLVHDTISFEDEFSDIQFIPLENNRDAMLSFVSKMIVMKDNIAILNNGNSENVQIFDHDGKYLGHVGEMGHGRGEYNTILDVSVDVDGHFVLSDFHRLLVYDSDGKYVCSENIPLTSRLKNIQCYNNGLIGASNYSGNNRLLHFFDKSNKLQREMLETDGISLGNPTRANNTLQIMGDTLCYFNPYNSVFTLINLKDCQIIKQYTLVSSRMRSIEIAQKEESEDLNDVDEVLNFYLDNGKVFCDLSVNYKRMTLVIDIKTNKSILRLKNGWFPDVYDVQDNYYYSYIEQVFFMDLINGRYKLTQKGKRMLEEAYKKIGKEISPQDNYVIMRMKK